MADLIGSPHPAGPPDEPLLPPGFGVALDPAVVSRRDGRVLVGGRPLQIMRLSKGARDALERLRGEGSASEAARRLGRRLVDASLANPRPPATPVADVTVVIPVHDRPVELDDCLSALEPGTPVLVVDDGSTDGSAIAAVCDRHGAELLRLDRSGGPARARNAGVAAVSTGLVAFLDSDCVPPPGWLAPLVAHLADPTVGAAAPRIQPLERPDPGTLERFVEARSPLDMGPVEGLAVPGGLVSYVPTAALVVRRSALVEPFDAGLRYGEDIDMVWRLHDSGWRVRYEPTVTVRHSEPRTWRELLRRRRLYGTSAAPLSRRFPGRLAPLTARPWTVAAALLLLVQRFLPAIGIGALGALLRARRPADPAVPGALSLRRSARSLAQTVVGLGRFATRLWAPALLLAAPSRRGRRAALVLLLAPPLVEWVRRRPRLDPLRWTAASIAEDVAFGAGVWTGCVRERTAAPLVPSAAHEAPPTVVDIEDDELDVHSRMPSH